MAQYSKYVPAPWKMNAADAYGDPAEVLVDRLHETAAAVGLQNSFFPASADLDNGSPNLLDWGDHNLWLVTEGYRGETRNYTGSFVYTEGHSNNWKPARFAAGSLLVRNVGQTSDLPSGVTRPAWYQGGSIDLTGNHGSNDSWYAIYFRLKPNTTYTYSFYAKKLSSGSVQVRVGTGNGFSDPSTAQASNLVNLSLDDTALPVGAWTRLAYSFTTDASGYIVIHLGAWNAWTNGCTLRLAYPQLEEGPVATSWSPPRYWKYHPLPQPIALDDAINDANYAALFHLSLPGSAVVARIDVRPDWSLTGGTQPRFTRMWGTDPSSDETVSRRLYRNNDWYQRHPLWELSHLYLPYLGQEAWGVLRYGNGNSYRMVGSIQGVWVRHGAVGGLLEADSSSLSGPGHRKLLAWRVTDTGSNKVRLKMASVPGDAAFLPQGTVDLRYTRQAVEGTTYDNNQYATDSSVWFGISAIQGVASLNLDKAADLFIDAVGNAQGYCLNFFQNNQYATPVAVADFLNPPAAADDGSKYARWGMLVPNQYVGYEICSSGPLAVPYWPGWGPHFHSPYGWNNSSSTGEPPVPYFEVALGTRFLNRPNLTPLWAVHSDGVAACRGQMANLYLARNSAFPGNPGDSWLAPDGSRYYLAHKSGQYSGYAETYLLFVKP